MVRFVKRLCQGLLNNAKHVSVSAEALMLFMESLILAQNERWQRGLGMQVERDSRV